jgi:type VI secretion system VasD/TssJ family lipoprotein
VAGRIVEYRLCRRGFSHVWLAALMLAGGAMGCTASGVPVKGCLTLEASEDLNTYESEAHALTVYLFPLVKADGFELADIDELLEGGKPEGVVAPPVPLTLTPGQELHFEEMYPSQTRHFGVLADYYSTPRNPAGRRTRVVPVRCGLRKPKVSLSRNGID